MSSLQVRPSLFFDCGIRVQFEQWIDPEIRAIERCVRAREVGAIFTTGGSSFVPAIRRIFAQKFGADKPLRSGQEFTSVAMGLAIKAVEIFVV